MSQNQRIKAIGKLFGSLGITKRQGADQFWRSLEREFGQPARELGESIDRRSEGEPVPIYELKNHNREFANRVFSQFDAARVRAFLEWLVREEIVNPGEMVLEVGCDNGVFLSVCAQLYPETQFIGYEVCEKALSIAQERKQLLGLENLSFNRLDALSWDELPANSADILITQVTMHEVLGENSVAENMLLAEFPSDQFTFTPQGPIPQAPESATSYLKRIAGSLKSSGLYVSVERIPTLRDFHLWTNALSDVGLSVSHSRSYKLSFENVAKHIESMPVTVAEHAQETHRPIWDDDLAFWVYDSFLKKKDLSAITDTEIAELIYSALDKKIALQVEVVWKNGSGTMKKFIGTAGALGFLYTATSRDFRQLLLTPRICLNEIVAADFSQTIQGNDDVDVQFHVANHEELDRLGLKLLTQGHSPVG